MLQSVSLKHAQHDSWFRYWFDSRYYYKLYERRDEKEADLFVNRLVGYLQPGKDSCMLDVGCGQGRHCKFLAAKGFNTTGIDLSISFIREAKKYEDNSLKFFQHDMRLPFRINCFDYVFNFFTSFGYFSDEKDNHRAIAAMSKALKRDGRLVMDYLNIKHVEQNTVAEQVKEIDGTFYQITKWSDKSHFYKRIYIEDENLKTPLEYLERVAKFGLLDFEQLFYEHDLEIETVFGNYHLHDYDAETFSEVNSTCKKEEVMIIAHAPDPNSLTSRSVFPKRR